MKSVQCVRCHRLALPLLMFAVRSAALVLVTLAVIAPSAGADELEPVQEIPGQLVGLSDDGEVLAVLEIDSSAACVLLHIYQRGEQLWGLTQSVVVPTPLKNVVHASVGGACGALRRWRARGCLALVIDESGRVRRDAAGLAP